jgi:hypothetical protein
VLHAQRLGDVQLRLEGRRVDLGVRAVGDQAVVVEDLADLGGSDLAAQDRGVLVVPGELDLLVSDLGEPGEDPLEAVRNPAVVRGGADPVADAVEDDAAVLAGDQRFHGELLVAVTERRRIGLEHRQAGGADHRGGAGRCLE